MTQFAFQTYTGNGSTTQYSISWTYIDSTHVKCFLDGVSTSAFSVSGSTVTFNSAPANNVVIKIERQTPLTARLVDFQDGSVLTEADLDMSANQNFFAVQEFSDDATNYIQLDTDDKYNAQSKVIKSVANPVNDNDVVNKNYLENTWLSPTNKTALTTVNSNIANINAVNSNATNINSAVSNATNINTVATNIGSVNTVATDITKVIAVANDLAEAVSEIETVADDLNETSSEIDVVAGSIANVNTVGGAIANVNTVAGLSSTITAVSNNSSNINAVNTNSSNINTVAGQNSNITTLAGISANITTVAGISSNVTTVAGMNSAITSVNSNSSNINSVAGAITNINSVAGGLTNINTVATNLSGVNSFAERYRVQAGVPSSSNDTGDLVFDTTAGKLKVFDGSSYALAGSSVNGTNSRHRFTATAGQTTFTGTDLDGGTLSYDVAGGVAFIDVYLNGVHLDSSDYTATSGTSVVLSSGATVGDEIYITAFGTFSLASFSAGNITSGTINNARLTGSGAITINGSSVSLGGNITVGETKPTIGSISPSTITNAQTSITITGTNFVSVPQVEALNQSTGIWYTADTISFTNATTLVATFTLSVDAQYKLRIENPDGNAVLSSSNILTVSDAPTWSTSAGTLGVFAGNFSGTLATISASSDSTIAYSETTSVLTGAGVTINTSTGALTTTDFGASSTTPTTYNFTIRATDGEGQTTDRSFSMTSSFGATGGGQFN